MQNEKPTAKILHNPYDGKTIEDAAGRQIELKQYTLLDRYDLMSAMGDDANVNACLTHAILILYIKSIDRVPFELPRSYAEVRLALKKIPLETADAVAKYIGENNDFSEKGNNEKIKK